MPGTVCFLVAGLLFKKRSWHRCFPVNFEKFLEHFCHPCQSNVVSRSHQYDDGNNNNNLLGKSFNLKKQPSIGVLIKRCSKNMQQIYRGTPMPKCDSNKVAEYLIGEKQPGKSD